MWSPPDAVLLVVDAHQAIDDPRQAADDVPLATQNIATLIAA
jgi:hypothetical protein